MHLNKPNASPGKKTLPKLESVNTKRKKLKVKKKKTISEIGKLRLKVE